ncbi:hypothetical protein J3F84DRAFT_15284 [Trichoderma pleuroticola]
MLIHFRLVLLPIVASQWYHIRVQMPVAQPNEKKKDNNNRKSPRILPPQNNNNKNGNHVSKFLSPVIYASLSPPKLHIRIPS